jgi:hypothetical protein
MLIRHGRDVLSYASVVGLGALELVCGWYGDILLLSTSNKAQSLLTSSLQYSLCSLLFGLLQTGIDRSAALAGSLAFTLWQSGAPLYERTYVPSHSWPVVPESDSVDRHCFSSVASFARRVSSLHDKLT